MHTYTECNKHTMPEVINQNINVPYQFIALLYNYQSIFSGFWGFPGKLCIFQHLDLVGAVDHTRSIAWNETTEDDRISHIEKNFFPS